MFLIDAIQGFGLTTEGRRTQMIEHHLPEDISSDREWESWTS